MTGRRLTTGATLVVGVVVLCVMAVWGFHSATAPIDSLGGSKSTGPGCDPADQKITEFVRRGDVTVSVYNSGKVGGRAQATMDLLEHAGFKPGAVGNAPPGLKVARANVYTTNADDPGAELLAEALGKNTEVVHTDEEYGPGVDVVIGDRFKRLDPAAPKRIKLDTPRTTCK
jgi:hypothetical protein